MSPVSPRERLIIEILFQLSVRPISNESAKETKKPLAGSKDPSEDQGSNHPSEAGATSVSSTQLVYVVSDLGRLQEWVSIAALDTGSVNCGPRAADEDIPSYGMFPSIVASEWTTLWVLVPAVTRCALCSSLSGESRPPA